MRLPKYTTEKTKKLTEVILPICKNRLKNNDNNRIKTLIADFCNICKVVATDEECVNYATISDFEDFEDAMQYKCAEKAKADYIVTRNIKDFKTASIKVGTPEDFLEDFINQY